jgi:peptidyl-prolyl cis-trans isomerase B (cyclophilin B)
LTCTSKRTSPAFVAIAVLVVAACNPGATPGASPAGPSLGRPSPVATTANANCPKSQPAPLPGGQKRVVTISTANGKIEVTVEGALSPIAAGNFIALASCGFYNGVVFHRLVPGFVIQGGDPTGTGSGGPGYEIQDEPVTAQYHRGTIAMARAPGQPNSQGSQFFIVLSDQAAGSLVASNDYAIFGEVTAGMDTVDAIAAMPNSGLPNNAALQPVAMDSVTVSQP